jgi:hypothetical protein
MPSNIATIPGMNPVPMILMTAPPPVDPTDGRTSMTEGAGPDGAGGRAVMTVDGEAGNPDD